MKTSLMTYIVLSFLFASSCAKKVQMDIKKAADANQNAKNESDYKASEANPDKVVEQWKASKDSKLQEEICESFKKTSDSNLLVFSEQISNPENKELFEKCKEDLDTRLDAIHENLKGSQTIAINANLGEKVNLGFKMPFEVQYRDLSAGYKAVTGDVKPGELILTFDDGPHSQYTMSVLNTLASAGVKAHFFQVGRRVSTSPEVTKAVALEGHSVASHSWNHPCMGNTKACYNNNGGKNLTFNESVEEIRSTHQAIQDVLGFVDPFFRFPYGSSTPELQNYLKDSQVGEFFWNVDSEDWRMVDKDGTPRTNMEVISDSLNQLDQRKRGIVLFHDVHRRTAELLPEFLAAVQRRGYKIVLLQPAEANAKYNSRIAKRRVNP